MRILTQRDGIAGKSFVDVSENGILMWTGDDEELGLGFSFPVTLDFVERLFAEAGRSLDRSRLPPHVVDDPWRARAPEAP